MWSEFKHDCRMLEFALKGHSIHDVSSQVQRWRWKWDCEILGRAQSILHRHNIAKAALEALDQEALEICRHDYDTFPPVLRHSPLIRQAVRLDKQMIVNMKFML